MYLSVLLYGSEAWSLTSAMIKSINSFGTGCYCYMLNIRWTDMVRNEEVLRLVRRSPLVRQVVRRQFGLLGHNMRKCLTVIPHRYALYWPQLGKRKRGRPRLLYLKHIKQVTGLRGEQAIEAAAQDREDWKDRMVGWSSRLQPLWSEVSVIFKTQAFWIYLLEYGVVMPF